ncbi:hypothetical protein BKA64DRAFT_651362 [Cadophora sp. MPI-SDFR-AT-0126]|nr:hypothetical protein BKA64DRAFT_651362 [Leotiomycetes sp. MPI-SDFR-AT-0126]
MSATRTSIPLSQRAALRHYYQTTDPKPTHSALREWFSSQFGHEISQSIVSRSLGNSFAWLDACFSSVSGYRTRYCQWPWLERLLTDWLQELEGRSSRVSNEIIGAKAKQLWEQSDKTLGQPTPSFSTGWVVKFRRRHKMRLQSSPDQHHLTVTRSRGRISVSLSHGTAVDTSQQSSPASLSKSKESSSMSEAVTIIRSNKSASLNPEINSSPTLTFSSDHLIHLIQHNVQRALMTNKSLLSSATVKLAASGSMEFIKQFPTKICGGLTITRPLANRPMPDSLYPTKLQMDCAHTEWINSFPFPRFRDNLITRGVHFVPEDLFCALFGDIYPDYTAPILSKNGCTSHLLDSSSIPLLGAESWGINIEQTEDEDDYTAGREGLISWGDPWVVQNWEVTPGFLKSWGWALEGCDDLIQASNRWRASRNEKPITYM